MKVFKGRLAFVAGALIAAPIVITMGVVVSPQQTAVRVLEAEHAGQHPPPVRPKNGE